MKRLILITVVASLGIFTAVASAHPGPGPGKRGKGPQVSQAFIDCMKAEGVTKPARGEKPTAEQKAKAKAAFEACKQHLTAEQRARIEAVQKFRACMESKGAVKPTRGTRPTDEQREKNRAAFDACKSLLPKRK